MHCKPTALLDFELAARLQEEFDSEVDRQHMPQATVWGVWVVQYPFPGNRLIVRVRLEPRTEGVCPRGLYIQPMHSRLCPLLRPSPSRRSRKIAARASGPGRWQGKLPRRGVGEMGSVECRLQLHCNLIVAGGLEGLQEQGCRGDSLGGPGLGNANLSSGTGGSGILDSRLHGCVMRMRSWVLGHGIPGF